MSSSSIIATKDQSMAFGQSNIEMKDASQSVEKPHNREDRIKPLQQNAAYINQHSISSNYQVGENIKHALDTRVLPMPADAKYHLPIPTAAAVRDYYHSHMPPTPTRHNYIPRMGLSPATWPFQSSHVGRAMPSPVFKTSALSSSRRNSLSLSQSALTSPLARLNFSSSTTSTTAASRPTSSMSHFNHSPSNRLSHSSQNSPSATIFVINGGDMASENRAVLLTGVTDLRTSTYIPIQRASEQPRIQNPLDPRHLGRIPFDYTHQRLQQWGAVYMANSETADAYVIAVPLSRSPPTESTHLEPPQETPHPAYQVRARILPRDSARQPTVITKKFPQRSASMTTRPHPARTPTTKHSPNSTLRRHSSLQERQAPRRSHRLQHPPTSTNTTITRRASIAYAPPQPAHGVHIEYAVHSLPVVAAILLSGHMYKGDAVEVTMPQPQLWGKVVEWMYTGRVKEWGGGDGAWNGVEDGFWDLVTFLGGKVEGGNRGDEDEEMA
ncbi:MAG: hypothetical protein M1829_002748 [Trizodia sp. TS-e1964]|nr:MAG: hypothetical protein M1829_002748 [Trizodia sp. TS-e1964]